MQNLSKKLFAVVLAVVVLFAVLTLTACNSTCTGDHNFVLSSTTATCTESGTETYKCADCKETKTQAVEAYGHTYNKNVCERCNEQLTDLSQFPESYRNEIADKLLSSAPYVNGMDDYVTSTRLLQEAQESVTAKQNEVDTAQTEYDTAIEQANNTHKPADVSKAAAALTALLKAETELEQANSDLKSCKESYQTICEGYAWKLAITTIKASEVNNYDLNEKLLFLLSSEIAALDTTITPTWYSKITSKIETLTGIDIKTGA